MREPAVRALGAACFRICLNVGTECRLQPASLGRAFPTYRAGADILDMFPIMKRNGEERGADSRRRAC